MTDSNDRLDLLRQKLAELDDAPLSAHPDVLEQTHRALVEELERLEDLEDLDGASESGTPASRSDDGGPTH